jgi:hypothetical protein
VRARRQGERVCLTLPPREDGFRPQRLFPFSDEDAEGRALPVLDAGSEQHAERVEGGFRHCAPLAPTREAPLERLQGVLVMRKEGKRRAFRIDVPVRAEADRTRAERR